MEKFEFYAPTKVVFGKDTHHRAGELVQAEGAEAVLIVYGGESAKKSGLLAEIEKSLEEKGIRYLSLGGVVPNPLLSKAREMIAKALEFKADFILAVGGGSVIDNAKVVAHGVANPDTDVWDYYTGKKKLEKSMPHAAVLTISAAGSEMSNSAVITNDEITPHSKRGINTDLNRCRFAILNPELTYTLPKYQIGAGAADIFMHTSERYFAQILGNHLSDEIAEGLLRTITEFGVKAVENPRDYTAMSEVMWAGSISHNGITGLGSKGDTAKDGDWSCHQLSMPLSAIYDYTHGASLTAVWGSWARYVRHCNIARFAEFARKVYKIEESDDAKAAEAGILRSEEFFRRLGMPTSLRELMGREPSEEELRALAQSCSFEKSRTIGGFMILDYEDMYRIYKAAV